MASATLVVILLVASKPLATEAAEWLPPGDWTLEWSDEFDGAAGETPANWYPLLGYNPDDFKANTEKGIRWSGATADTAWMYSVKAGNHWLDGHGNLVTRIVSDKTDTNAHGPKVKSAYLLSGFPSAWNKSEPSGVQWDGKFVGPNNGTVYISSRIRTDEILGYSSWFAFWMFSETRAYKNDPTHGMEIDVVEVPKGFPDYMTTAFNTAQHWNQSGGDDDHLFATWTNPTSLHFVNVSDSDFHIWGVEWAKDSVKCYVDGKLYHTFTDHIASDPIDMMMMLTFEFQPNIWNAKAGDGRTVGPFVSDNSTLREMSRATVDYVRIYQLAKQ